ncbi:unnamed protein product [Acanthoscelides obtectus]|uniref:Uncharacterized protein n=1 Tax=Acanthoscelides obtectus TaxID=200917 RepID=A0A9P0L2N8_ACAOB|nr:unnamed protein product [Acanthoscelides obtectus]CAK1661167.1 hypothetical protein AOBTE_LOCUS22487 [Acanthoscelides obtectus]
MPKQREDPATPHRSLHRPIAFIRCLTGGYTGTQSKMAAISE